jgi:hypothetical protein
MSWSGPFIDALYQTHRVPRWFIKWERIASSFLGISPIPLGEEVTVGSHSGLGCDFIGLQEPVFQGAQLSPATMSSTLSGWSVDIVGSTTCRALVRKYLTRGSIISLKFGYQGMGAADFQRVALGQIRNIYIFGQNRIRLEVNDFLTALRGKFTIEQGLAQSMFSDAGTTTTAAANPPGSNPYTVTSTTDFKKETGADGAIYLASTLGDPYYIRWSASTATTFTNASVGVRVLDTTDVGTLLNDVVTSIAYIKDHPINIARKMLVSTGGGANGVQDTLPNTWGWAVPVQFIDYDDSDNFIRASGGPSSTYHWEAYTAAPVEDGYGWLSALLAKGGFFLAQRQGCLTVRCLQNVNVDNGTTVVTGIAITEADIFQDSEIEHELFCSEWNYEYGQIQITTNAGTGTATGAIGTWPAQYSYNIDLSTNIFHDDIIIRTEIFSRIKTHLCRIPERIVITKAHLRLAQLTIGDICFLNMSILGLSWDRYAAAKGQHGINLRRVLVTEVTPDFIQGYCRIALMIYPTDDFIFEE